VRAVNEWLEAIDLVLLRPPVQVVMKKDAGAIGTPKALEHVTGGTHEH